MEFFIWDDRLKTGLYEIDDQHKFLIDVLNILYTKMKEGKGYEVINSELKYVNDMMKGHFKTEERFMELYRYDKSKEHIEDHNKLKKKLDEITENYKEKLTLPIELFKFLKDYLENHISKYDFDLIEHIRKRLN